MDAVKKIENKFGELFKGAPPLPPAAKEGLAKAWPWIALIFGILQLFAAWGLWTLASTAERLDSYAQTLSQFYTNTAYNGLSSMDRTIIYMGIFVLLADAVILLMAYPHLVRRAMRGWHLLFIGSLLNLVYSLVSLFIEDRGIAGFFWSGVSSVIGFYLLFQVREKYGAPKTAKSPRDAKSKA